MAGPRKWDWNTVISKLMHRSETAKKKLYPIDNWIIDTEERLGMRGLQMKKTKLKAVREKLIDAKGRQRWANIRIIDVGGEEGNLNRIQDVFFEVKKKCGYCKNPLYSIKILYKMSIKLQRLKKKNYSDEGKNQASSYFSIYLLMPENKGTFSTKFWGKEHVIWGYYSRLK